MKTYTPIKYHQVYAIQFLGWENAEDVIASVPGAFFVPQGYKHALRRTDEVDVWGEKIKVDAPAFISIKSTIKDNSEIIRADIGQWITLSYSSDSRGIEIFSEEEFNRIFVTDEQSENEENGND